MFSSTFMLEMPVSAANWPDTRQSVASEPILPQLKCSCSIANAMHRGAERCPPLRCGLSIGRQRCSQTRRACAHMLDIACMHFAHEEIQVVAAAAVPLAELNYKQMWLRVTMHVQCSFSTIRKIHRKGKQRLICSRRRRRGNEDQGPGAAHGDRRLIAWLRGARSRRRAFAVTYFGRFSYRDSCIRM